MSTIQYVILVLAGAAVAAPCSIAQAADNDRWSSVFPEAGAEPRLVVPGLVSTGDDESHPTLSPDGHTLYFLKNTPSFDFYTIVFIERKGNGWTSPSTVSFSGQYPDGDLVFGPDGTHAFFVSARPVDGVPRTDTDIWTIERTASGWVIAAKDRGDALGCYDLYLSRQGPDGWTKPVNPGAPINSEAWEFSPRMSPQGDLFFFTSNRGFGSIPLKNRLTFDALIQRIRSPGNGLRDIYVLDATTLLNAEP